MYAELHCLSNYSFLRGASHPQELVARAAELGYRAIALTDECSFAGIVKAHLAAKAAGIQLIIGTELRLDDDCQSASGTCKLILLAADRRAYSEISALITRARRRSDKGHYQLSLQELQFGTRHCLAIWLPQRAAGELERGARLKRFFNQRLWLGVQQLQEPADALDYQHALTLAQQLGIAPLACNDVHMHRRERKALQDVLSAIRLKKTVQTLGSQRQYNSERHLRRICELQACYPQALLDATLDVARRCQFSLDELRYEYPKELIPATQSPSSYLRQLTLAGAARRWPQGIPAALQSQLDKELAVIAELQYEYYFLTVEDIVRFARRENILCQGRGSAANSAVCYCLFITEVDPARSQLLFERFISRERNEPPDIDVDFEHERREEVIQYIYRKYSRERAALAASVISYRRRSAIRDLGRALQFSPALIERLLQRISHWDSSEDLCQQLPQAGLQPDAVLTRQFARLLDQIIGFPRHLSQHVGGFIITHSPISTLVPVENAAMPERTIIQWDKNDIEALGLLKVDILALGMLTAIRKTLALVQRYQPAIDSMAAIPADDKSSYNMLCRGDSIGVFQVESRAQMAMLPRLQPRCFYDLVIQVAIVRPGPIQGDMVHPYLQRRSGQEAVDYPSPQVQQVLERTLGVPIFQEQVISLAMVAAGFSGGEADQLRRAMASWGQHGNLQGFKHKLINGMRERGHSEEFAERLFKQMQGFGEYGFPESHAASFALLVYVSAWLKCHHPLAFYCALLNSLPMGFYSASQLVQDARRHRLAVHPVDIRYSGWEHQIEFSAGAGQPTALRLGFCLVKGLGQRAATALISARQQRPFRSLRDLAQRSALARQQINALVNSNALHSLSGHRHQAHWQALAASASLADSRAYPLLPPAIEAATATLPRPDEIRDLQLDYASTGLTLKRHPMAILRTRAPFKHCRRAADLAELNHGRFVRIAGLVTGRQRPGSAAGVLFVTLEDETGNSNIVVWRDIQQRFHQPLQTARLLLIKGVLERKERVIHIIAGEILDCSEQLPALALQSRDFH